MNVRLSIKLSASWKVQTFFFSLNPSHATELAASETPPQRHEIILSVLLEPLFILLEKLSRMGFQKVAHRISDLATFN